MEHESVPEATPAVAGAVAEARSKASLSMRELARKSGLSAAQVSRIEAGDVAKPSVGTLVRLAVALDGDSDLLLVASGQVVGQEAREILQARAEPAAPAIRQRALDRLGVVAKAETQLILAESVMTDTLEEAQADRDESARAYISMNQALGASETAIEVLREQHGSVADGAYENHARLEAELAAIESHGHKVRAEIDRLSDELTDIREQLANLEADPELADIAARLFVESTGSAGPAMSGSTPQPGSSPDRIVESLEAQTTQALESLRLRLATEEVAKEVAREMDAVQKRMAAFIQAAAAKAEITDPDLREIQRRWRYIEPARQKKILDFVEDQHFLSVERREAMRILDAATDEEMEEPGDEFQQYMTRDWKEVPDDQNSSDQEMQKAPPLTRRGFPSWLRTYAESAKTKCTAGASQTPRKNRRSYGCEER
jgi:transcriptional regulator with XRE-family HTH domain